MPVDFLSTCFCAPLSILGFLLLCAGGWLHGKFMQVCRQIISKVGSSEGSAYAVSRRECSGSAWRQVLHELPVMTGCVHANFSTKFTYKARRNTSLIVCVHITCHQKSRYASCMRSLAQVYLALGYRDLAQEWTTLLLKVAPAARSRHLNRRPNGVSNGL